jgi:nicotinamidase-related amidase
MKLDINNCCLLIIDLQEKLLPHIFNKEQIKHNSNKLVELFVELNIPIIYTEQYPKGLGSTVNCLKKKLIDNNSKKIEKTTFSAFDNEDFKNFLTQINKKQVILLGIESHICVLQTTIDLLESAKQVYIVEECIGSRKLGDANISIKRMLKSGASLINFEMIFFELIRDSKNQFFKKLSSKYIK